MAQADFQLNTPNLNLTLDLSSIAGGYLGETGGYTGGSFAFMRQAAAGNIALLWDSNYQELYHKFSPYSNGLSGRGVEPFYYVYIDQMDQYPNSALKSDTRAFPQGSATVDITRIQGFMSSFRGSMFITRQNMLQQQSPYNERQVYNQDSPLVAAAMSITPGAVNPEQAKDTSNGGRVPGTTFADNSDALPSVNIGFASKGLIRGATAVIAKANLRNAWPSQVGGSSSGGFSTSAASVATTTFRSTQYASQYGVDYRSDEGAYGMMIAGGASKFPYKGASGNIFGFGQQWVAGQAGYGIRKNNEYTAKPYRLFVQATNGIITTAQVDTSAGLNEYVRTIGTVGYIPKSSSDGNKPGYRYGDTINTNTAANKDFEGSDIMYQYAKYYADPSQKFPTKPLY